MFEPILVSIDSLGSRQCLRCGEKAGENIFDTVCGCWFRYTLMFCYCLRERKRRGNGESNDVKRARANGGGA